VNFIKNLRAHFFVQKCFAQLFSSYRWLCNFWQKDIGEKSAHKMLMKMSPGLSKVVWGVVVETDCTKLLEPEHLRFASICW